jgi:O-antigen/teichoic acid export membrane protein
MYRAIAANKRNTVFIIGIFLLIIAGLGYAANYFYGGGTWSIFIATIVGAGLYTLIQYFARSAAHRRFRRPTTLASTASSRTSRSRRARRCRRST